MTKTHLRCKLVWPWQNVESQNKRSPVPEKERNSSYQLFHFYHLLSARRLRDDGVWLGNFNTDGGADDWFQRLERGCCWGRHRGDEHGLYRLQRGRCYSRGEDRLHSLDSSQPRCHCRRGEDWRCRTERGCHHCRGRNRLHSLQRGCHRGTGKDWFCNWRGCDSCRGRRWFYNWKRICCYSWGCHHCRSWCRGTSWNSFLGWGWLLHTLLDKALGIWHQLP